MKGLNQLKQEQGSQVLEFILVAPLVWLLFLFAVDQFTIMYNKQQALSAAYEAGRIACVQPNAGLARYHGSQKGREQLQQAIGMESGEVTISPRGQWQKGSHLISNAQIQFRLLASGQPYVVKESYSMMIENAEDKSQ
ncbi:TadE/TadG family type IV pilus assembly protein [Brevibacillus ginsengisoli]|uniref:TadE/TadG family type IV pilus assembly protein n=1 Tax=Brevibacillus ginsengisoli TaxID=363854 RepID=UPI003CFB6023